MERIDAARHSDTRSPSCRRSLSSSASTACTGSLARTGGRETRAELPAEVARGAFGPRLQAAVATLAVRNRVRRRDSAELARELFGVELATGTIDAIVQRTGEALAEPQARLVEHLRCAAAVNIDETGWRLRGGKRALWGALTERAAVFRIAPNRHEREARDLLAADFAASPARIAGGPTTTSTPAAARSAGHT